MFKHRITENVEERALRQLHDQGIPREYVELCPVQMINDRHMGMVPVFFTRVAQVNKDTGQQTVACNQPWQLKMAMLRKQDFVGYLYEDGTLSQDSDMVVDERTLEPELPVYVVLYNMRVPPQMRAKLAANRQKHHDNKIIIQRR